jgi:PleD family two-component response regulator
VSAVLVASDSQSDVDLIRGLLKQEDFAAEGCADPMRLAAEFERAQPQVLVLAFKTMEVAERHYLGLYRRSQIVSTLPHRTLLLCQAEQTHEAYLACRAGVFDDYVPFWPLAHDGWMLPKAIHLALRAIDGQRQSAAAQQVAAQARRIAELESLLDAQVAVGRRHTDALAMAGEAAQAGVSAALRGLERRIVDTGLEDAVVVRDAGLVHRELDRIQRQQVNPALDQVSRAIAPLRQWAGGLKDEFAAPLDAARAVARQARALHPKVLVVDDDHIAARVVKQVVGSAGYEVQVADDAAQAMQVLRQDTLDLVMLDVDLPDINGIELLRRMRANPALASLPVLMLTGHGEKETIVACMAAGASDFVVKPFARDALLMKIERLVGGRGVAAA